MYFPPEIWEHIFLYSDAVTLTNLKIVCNIWNEIINKTLKTNNHWFIACKRDIPEHLWSTFCESLNPTKYYTEFHEKHDSQMWMALYKLWRTCKNVMRWNVDAKCIVPLRSENTAEHITCVETSGSIIAIGSSEGYIYFYDICDLYERAFYVADLIEEIESIQFVRDEICTICICRSKNNHISRLDVTGKTLIDTTRGELICTSYSYCYTILRDMIIIEGLIPRTVYKLDTTKVIAIGADNDQVHLYTRENFVHFELDSEVKNVFQKASPSKLPNISIRRFYVFKPDTVVCIAENGYLGFLVNGKQWEMHNLFPILLANPTTVLVYGHTLIIGVDSGSVHAYYIDDFGTINFNTIRSKKFTPDCTAVVSLNILVHIETHLIVSYMQKVYIVQLT
ncbi:uncharacterized protein LOC143208440 [Lasioglossum baleicum]|uniref:uncharacterized protein LOC143208440 n=1 Tax=Lasioglossum baleicum TaxID=434251 RepID=UPI003FCC434F